MAYVISDECVACGSCAAVCPAEAISEGDGKYVIDADACLECGTCEAECRPALSPLSNLTGNKNGICIKIYRYHFFYYSDSFAGRGLKNHFFRGSFFLISFIFGSFGFFSFLRPREKVFRSFCVARICASRFL